MKLSNRYIAVIKWLAQGGVILCLTIALVLPYVGAQTDVPAVPTTTPTAPTTSTIPTTSALPTDDLARTAREQQREAERTINDQQRELLDQSSENVPDTLREAMSADARQSTQDANRNDAYTDLENGLADAGITDADPVALSEGNIGSLVDGGITDPLALSTITGNIQRSYNDSYNQSLLASMQATWAAGIQGGGNCSTSDDDGKDLCQELTDLEDLLSNINDDLSNMLSRARRLRIYLSAKPAFLNTSPARIPICIGLITPGLGENLANVDIAETTDDYNTNNGMMSMGAIKNGFVASGDLSTGGGAVTAGDPVNVGTQFTSASSTTFRESVTNIQSEFDRITLLGWQNFDNSLQVRFDVLKAHSDELKTLLDQLSRVQRSLNQRSKTP